ncbi:unnamed protein product [Allacma fusca]|uniref:Uncharacterized protein n=1 Tax=Allacma fusca TaxID=39272 RepID=A0A8J2JN08_9HEXA|nr:unnamed protein product [Allacma fusca]
MKLLKMASRTIFLIVSVIILHKHTAAIESGRTNAVSKGQDGRAIRVYVSGNNSSYFSNRNPKTTATLRSLQPQRMESDNWNDMKITIKYLARSLKSLQQAMTSRVAKTHEMIANLEEDVKSLKVSKFDQFRTFALDEEKIECLTGNADRTNMNNSLSMYFTSRNETLDKEISQLYKTYDATRLCLSQDEALHWLQKLILKAGLSNAPVAIFHSQTGVEEPKEEVNGSDSWVNGCKNLERLDRNSSVVYVYNNSCVRLYTEQDCHGESFLFTGNDGAGFPFVGSLKYYDKKGRN